MQPEPTTTPYAAASPAQMLDLYLPGGTGPFPLVLWIHGGGWRSGSRALGTDAPQRRVLAAGYALASVGYRLSGEATFPAQIHDAKAAVRWLRTNAAAHRLGGWIAAWGASAGGHLAALLGTSAGVADLEGAHLGYAGESSAVDAVVDWYGPTDFLRMDAQTAEQGCPEFGRGGHDAADSPESRLMGFPVQQRPGRVRAADPITYVSGDEPPFLIQHGDRDCTVPHAQGRLLHEALRRAGADSTFELLPAGHGGAAFRSERNVQRILQFLDGVRR